MKIAIISPIYYLISSDLPIIFPMHPRTRELFVHLEDAFNAKIAQSSVTTIELAGYIDFLCLQKNAALVLTDSDGGQVARVISASFVLRFGKYGIGNNIAGG